MISSWSVLVIFECFQQNLAKFTIWSVFSQLLALVPPMRLSRWRLMYFQWIFHPYLVTQLFRFGSEAKQSKFPEYLHPLAMTRLECISTRCRFFRLEITPADIIKTSKFQPVAHFDISNTFKDVERCKCFIRFC